ncbi:MAG TPA: hypothetical protein PKW15_00110 [Alphaproteobacteria bacterium]|nr:hypothetical protein [Rhodospirillaceae bacterium]HRJ11627.1 hypothetical protein [Alphaproteobacteria bacterium]
MTQLLLTIIIGIGIAVVATGGALTLFQSARDGVDQQLLWARMEQTAAAIRAKTLIVDGLPVLPMPETTTDSYPAVPTWVTANATDTNGKRFVYCPFALRDTIAEGTSTTVTGPGYSVKTYNSAITGGKDYVVGAVRPALTGTVAAAPQGLLGLLISFKPKDTFSATVAANWCTASSLAVSASGVISATHSSQTGVVYPLTAPQGPVQQALTKRDVVTFYVSTSASGDGTGRNTSNYTTLNAAFAQLAALRPLRAKIYLNGSPHTLSTITKLDAGGDDVYNRGNLQQTTYDIEGAGSGSTTVTLNLTGDYDLPVNMIWRSLTLAVNDTERVVVPPNTKTIIADSIINNLYVKQGTAWVRGTSALNNSVTVTDDGRLVINGTVTSSVTDQGIKLQPGRIDVLPSTSWAITATSAASTPSAPVIVYGGAELSNSGSMTITSDGSTQLKSAINIVPGGVVNMNNATLTLNSGSSTIAGDGSTRKGAIVAGGAMYMVNSGLLFPGSTGTDVAGVVLVDGGKFFMHSNSYIGSSSDSAQRPYVGVFDNGGTQVGGSTAGYSSGAAGEGGGARSNVYAHSSGKCWDGNGDPYGLGIPASQERHLFIDSDEGDTESSAPKNTCGSNTDGTCSAAAVANLLTYTDNLASAAWSDSAPSATARVQATGITAPDGSSTAVRLYHSRANSVSLYTARQYTPDLSMTGQYQGSIYLKAAVPGDIGKTITIWTHDGVSSRNLTNITLTGSWARYTMADAYSFSGTVSTPMIVGLSTSGNTTLDVTFDAWGAQLESGTSETDYAPVGHTSANNPLDYRHLRLTNSSDWLCTGGGGGGGGGGDTDPDDGGVLAGCPATNSTGMYTTTPDHTPTGFDTTTTISISCPGCAGLSGHAGYSKNGGAVTTGTGTFSPGDYFNIEFCFGSNGAATATVTIGTTDYTCEYTKTGRVAPACVPPTP